MSEKFESIESPQPQFELLSAGELEEIVYGGEDPSGLHERFLPPAEGGVFKYFDTSTFRHRPEKKFFPVIKIEGTIVGLGELEESPYKDNRYWVSFVSVDPQYQNKGYASMLVEEIFKFIKERNAELQLSYFSEQGGTKLKKVFERLSEKYSIPLISNTGIGF